MARTSGPGGSSPPSPSAPRMRESSAAAGAQLEQLPLGGGDAVLEQVGAGRRRCGPAPRRRAGPGSGPLSARPVMAAPGCPVSPSAPAGSPLPPPARSGRWRCRAGRGRRARPCPRWRPGCRRPGSPSSSASRSSAASDSAARALGRRSVTRPPPRRPRRGPRRVRRGPRRRPPPGPARRRAGGFAGGVPGGDGGLLGVARGQRRAGRVGVRARCRRASRPGRPRRSPARPRRGAGAGGRSRCGRAGPRWRRRWRRGARPRRSPGGRRSAPPPRWRAARRPRRRRAGPDEVGRGRGAGGEGGRRVPLGLPDRGGDARGAVGGRAVAQDGLGGLPGGVQRAGVGQFAALRGGGLLGAVSAREACR